MSDLLELIEEFEELIQSKDTNYTKMSNFLKNVGRKLPKNVIPPMIEFVTILREENPHLYYELRDHIPSGTHLYDLIRIEIPYDVAKSRLQTRKDRKKR
ncbi:hypothetical protein [Ammoniphilus resinae]|uniref:Uncharacterized protein n=1 Tax=Ammoniphilus resinae TaxID=861532 RepID=A0ABS4GK22_9BACL|nr:hypothetical protein [Ammoniphilus resinae]MBP1930594.1 hypothetical protein [Ammoniphilus resinae]